MRNPATVADCFALRPSNFEFRFWSADNPAISIFRKDVKLPQEKSVMDSDRTRLTHWTTRFGVLLLAALLFIAAGCQQLSSLTGPSASRGLPPQTEEDIRGE